MRTKLREGSDVERRVKILRNALLELGETDDPILVEGIRDKAALERAGVCNPIFPIARSPEKVAEAVSRDHKRVFVFTDLDDTGEELLARTVALLHGFGVQPDAEMRKRLGQALGLRCFEDFDGKVAALLQEERRK